MTRSGEFKRFARTTRRLAVIAGRSVLFGLVPSVLVDSVENRRLPDDKIVFHDVTNAAFNLLIATGLLDMHVLLIRRD